MARAKNDTNPETSRSNRLTVPLTADNEIDWESVRPSVKEQLLSIVNNDVTILEHIGMSHEAGGSSEDGIKLPEITQENIGAALDILTRTNALAFRMLAPKILANPVKSKFAGKRVPMEIDLDIAIQSFQLTKAQHEEIDPRAKRLADKYIPAEASEHLDIILLVGMFLKFQADNCLTAMQLQTARDTQRIMANGQPAPPVKKPDEDKPVKERVSNKVNGHAPQEGATPDSDEDFESLDPGAEPIV